MTARVFFKLALLTILPLAVAAFTIQYFVARITVSNLEASLEQSLREKARLAEFALDGLEPAAYQSAITDLAERSQARVTVIDAQGKVLADSDAEPVSMENHAGRPEFAQALQGAFAVSRRFSNTIGVRSLYVAVPMAGGRAIRLSLPLSEVTSLVGENQRRITEIVLYVVLPLILGTALFARRISGQLSKIIAFSNELANGNFDAYLGKISAGNLAELDELGESLQTTAGKLRSTFNQLQDERSRFAAAVNGIGEGILVADRKRRIVLFNPAIEQMFPDENLTPNAALDDWTNQEIPRLFEQAIENGGTTSLDLDISEPSARSWRVSCAPITSRKGKVQAVAAVFHDVTELERVDRMRRDFVINVSHELRTPLAVVSGYAETLLDGALDDPDNSRRFVKIIWQNSQRLTQLTSDLMALSQIEGKTREFEFTRHVVADLLGQAADGVSPLLEKKSIEFKVMPVDDDLSLACDAGAIHQIIGNLIDNGIKYTPAGGQITIGARERPKRIEFYVKDTGIGIPAEHIPRLFERFYRVDKARSRELGGTGLGLAIVKHLVLAHHGAVWVESEPDAGSTFWFSLPHHPQLLASAVLDTRQAALF